MIASSARLAPFALSRTRSAIADAHSCRSCRLDVEHRAHTLHARLSDGNWPPRSGMTLEENLADLRRHADDFSRGAGFTFTVLDPGDNDVIGYVYLYPSASKEWDVT